MNESIDPIILAFALLAIFIAFKTDILRAFKKRKIEKTKNNSNKKSTDGDNLYDFSSSFDSGDSGDFD
ncbi:hypothetical protein [Siansivirga zeaxanthinifaciens]|uniref:Uncharacterized protein n=1 Tax=Siansivirga zeaxanthinifaciens CC-SAMT-1 TaxID=1454006 RepID=A0A0C5WPZ0_9FLAO|nr:hypothetical protein [Siansivirga zeaxanthinifaciens]AJR05015.1 hypothetical protein AW14_14600 [Siansivirga zeaxanthinifaciens CC-SAMT-1]